MNLDPTDAVAAVWRSVARNLAPLAAAAAAAAEDAAPIQPGLEDKLLRPLEAQAAGLMELLSRTSGMVAAALSEEVPQLLFKVVSASCIGRFYGATIDHASSTHACISQYSTARALKTLTFRPIFPL